jgi:hypothetical protein
MALTILNAQDPRGILRVAGVLVPGTDEATNHSLALAYDTDGNCTQIEMTYDLVTYRQTLSWSGGNCTAISTWSVV